MRVTFRATDEELERLCRLVCPGWTLAKYPWPGPGGVYAGVAVFVREWEGRVVNLLVHHGRAEGEYSLFHGPGVPLRRWRFRTAAELCDEVEVAYEIDTGRGAGAATEQPASEVGRRRVRSR